MPITSASARPYDRPSAKSARRARFRALAAGLLACAAPVFALLGTSAPAHAQAASREVVQPLPDPNKGKLDAAMKRLARNPKDVSALVDAGDAATGLGDFQAAKGFYKRADEISPNNPQTQAGLARAMALGGDPVGALPLFAAADRGGIGTAQIAADWGLAYDLAGDNASAQRMYAQATNPADADEVRLRLAVSQAISGDGKAADDTLMPLLRKQDKPAWRTRAFVYAIGGDTTKAETTVAAILPAKLAEAVTPYMRYMPRLTRAQQAAAANLGDFPKAAEIGTDSPAVAAYSAQHGSTGAVRSADAGLIPQGEALGSGRAKKKHADRGERPTPTQLAANTPRVAPGEVQATIERDSSGELPPVDAGRSTAMAGNTPMPSPTAMPSPTVAPPTNTAAMPNPARASTPAPERSVPERSASTVAMPAPITMPSAAAMGDAPAAVRGDAPAATSRPVVQPTPEAPQPQPQPQTRPQPGFDLAQSTGSRTLPAAAADTPPPPSSSADSHAVVERPTLAQAFADLGRPTLPAPQPTPLPAPAPVPVEAPKPVVEAPVATVTAAKEVAKPVAKPAPRKKVEPKKPAPPPVPARKWVQIGVGSNMNAIRWTWRQLVLKAPDAFRGQSVFTADMGGTNRIVVGPFDSDKDAAAFMSDLRDGGISDTVPWSSDAGEAVEAVPGAPSVDAISPPSEKSSSAKKKGAKASDKAADEKGDEKDSGKATGRKGAKKAEAKAPPAPARQWVQIGVGRDKDALAFTWNRLAKKSPSALKGQSPSVAKMGRTNRMVIGPFASDKAAQRAMDALKKGGITDFVPWSSDEGEAVDALPVD
ncbi:SPOR domain-containing protein [Novosphingobium sp. 9]|uniref:SPOR domain-containing protein n=1 Tax=Novosphingobium sp. 9 TaxID=2025349 RepID=UPI0021B52440|nr:SPOR domain-containing protein [Novosphingobium sp. 9]